LALIQTKHVIQCLTEIHPKKEFKIGKQIWNATARINYCQLFSTSMNLF